MKLVPEIAPPGAAAKLRPGASRRATPDVPPGLDSLSGNQDKLPVAADAIDDFGKVDGGSSLLGGERAAGPMLFLFLPMRLASKNPAVAFCQSQSMSQPASARERRSRFITAASSDAR